MIEFFKQFKRAAGRNLFYTLRWIIRKAPYRVYRVFAKIFFKIGQSVMHKKKQLAYENLRAALGYEMTEAQLRNVARMCFENFGHGMVELIYLLDRPELISERVEFEGRDHLDAALMKGNGAVLVSAHFGNFILMYLALVMAGYKTNVIMRRVRDKVFEDYISDLRREKNVGTIYDLPPRKCVQQSIKCLRNNEVLIILLDQNYGSAGRVFVEFFGHDAATAAGPVVFSNRTGAPILPMFIRGIGEEKHKIIISPPVEFVYTANDEEAIQQNVQKISSIIENQIRKYPYEWGGWMHKRWKTKPLEEQRIIDALRSG